MYTNNPPAGAFRGFGVVQAMFGIESAMDMLAEKLGMDPLELRKLNALRKGCETNTGHRLEESVGLPECLDVVGKRLEELGVSDPWTPREEEIDGRRVITCWGMASGILRIPGWEPARMTAAAQSCGSCRRAGCRS